MEIVPNGELFDYVVAHGRVKENMARKFFYQVASGIDYLHSNSVIHRDLKVCGEKNKIKIDPFEAIKIPSYVNAFLPPHTATAHCAHVVYIM